MAGEIAGGTGAWGEGVPGMAGPGPGDGVLGLVELVGLLDRVQGRRPCFGLAIERASKLLAVRFSWQRAGVGEGREFVERFVDPKRAGRADLEKVLHGLADEARRRSAA